MKPVIISGCSGGGKSALITELGRRGFAVSEEIGRRLIRAGGPRPGEAPLAFARAVAAGERDRLAACRGSAGPLFFDRSLIDQIAFCRRLTGECPFSRGDEHALYHEEVFLVPPWPEIYARDPERQHDLQTAAAEYDDLLAVYAAASYRTHILPKAPVSDRADLVMRTLGL